MPGPDRLKRSREELRAAEVLAANGFLRQAVSRAYFGAFFAAEAALRSLGESRSKHAGVISAFGRRVVKEGKMDEGVGQILRSLFERRNEADYGPAEAGRGEVGREEADRAIEDAQRFVQAVEDWLARRVE